MTKVIIFKSKTGGVCIVTPAKNTGLSIDQIAKKSVPVGLPYKIVDADTIPSDRTFRDAWEVDESQLTDGVGE